MNLRYFFLKIIFIIYFIQLLSCHPYPLHVKFINKTKEKYFVGELYDDEYQNIKQEIRIYCSRNFDSTAFFPRSLNGNDSTTMLSNSVGWEKVFAINIDSMNEFCKSGENYPVQGKKWVKIYFVKNISPENKKVIFVIK